MTADLRLLTAINRALERTPHVPLEPDRIEAHAARREGVERVPGTHWRPAFEALCADLEGPADLHRLGRLMAVGQLVGLLRARCRAERLLARFPGIHEQPVPAPIIIMGPMRSGSTRLQRLLACDRRLAFTRLFETLFPVPNGRGGRSRIAAAAGVQTMLGLLNPQLQRIHPTGPLRPEEEFGYLSFAFHSAQFAVQWNVPGLLATERKRDPEPVAAELRTLVKMNGWARGGTGKRPWVLKCPAYSELAEALLDAFPDARLVCLSRDPARVVASSASLVHEQRRIHSDAVDRHEIGREWLARTAERQRLLAAVRTLRPDVPAFDLHYDEMSADWVGVMHRLYRFLELPLTVPLLSAMRRYMRAARAHLGHRYALEDYGLEDAMVRAAFSPPPISSPMPLEAL